MFARRRLSACVALVGFCFSLLLVSIKPVFADDPADYLVGTWFWSHGASRSDWPNLNSAYQPDVTMTAYGVNAMPFAGKNIGGGDDLVDYAVGSMLSKRFGWGSLVTYYPDIVLCAGFSNPVPANVKFHMLVKFGAGYTKGSISKLDSAIHGFWYVGHQPYSGDSYAKASYIGSSAWPSNLNNTYTDGSGSHTVFSDYTSGYCYRVDFDAPARYPDGGYAISGIGLWCENWCTQYNTADNQAMGLIVGYLVCWADTGVAAIDDAITDILTHVAKIDGNVQAIYSALQSLLSIAKQINIDTTDIVKLLQAINSSTTLLQSDVACIYDLLKNALADESASLDNKSKDAAEKIMQQSNGEQYWMDKNTDNFNALEFDKFSFSNGVVGALSSVGSLFSSVWNALGDAVVIFTFPLMLGIALVLVGRISRQQQRSKGGKGKGDSGGKGGGKK